MESSIELDDSESNPGVQRKLLFNSSQILSLDIYSNVWSELTMREALSEDYRRTGNSEVSYFMNLTNRDLSRVRVAYNLHPVVDNECSNSSFTVKDQVLGLGENILVTFSDLNMNCEYHAPISIRILILQNRLLIFSSEPVFSIAYITRKEKISNFKIYSIEEFQDYDLHHDFSDIEGYRMEGMFIKILEITLVRLEHHILIFEKEAYFYLDLAANSKVNFTFDFLKDMIEIDQSLHNLSSLVKAKDPLFKSLSKCARFDENSKLCFKHFNYRVKGMISKITEVFSVLEIGKHMHETYYKESKRKRNKRLDEFSHVLEATALIMLPLDLALQLSSCNLKVPFQDVKSYLPVSITVGCIVGFIIIMIIYLKMRNML